MSRSSKKSPDVALHLSLIEQVRGRKGIHLWLLDLDSLHLAGAPPSITQDELHRVKRLKDPVLRARARLRFALSRQLLAGVLGTAPSELAFVNGTCGKPRVVTVTRKGSTGGDVSFNLSHSENVMAIAVAFGLDVGVDVEVLDYSKGDFSFYRDWTLQEAAAKLVGVGIALRAPAPSRQFSTKSMRATIAGRDVIVAVAAGRPSELPDPYQGIAPEYSRVL